MGSKNEGVEMKQKASLVLLLMLFFIGVDYEFGNISNLDISTHNYFNVINAILILLLYILPFYLILRKLFAYWQVPRGFIPVFIAIGYFSTGWIAGYGNELFSKLIYAIAGKNDLTQSWSDALTAPLVEETAKFLAVFLIIYLLKNKNLKLVFLVGVCVGLGFQISEDITYVLDEASKSIQTIVPQAFSRISGSISSHWLYTGLLSIGVFSLLDKQAVIPNKFKWLCLLSPLLLHFLWNSPLNEFPLTGPILNTISILILIKIFQLLNQQQEKILEEG